MGTTVFPRIRLVLSGNITGVQTWSVGVSTTAPDLAVDQVAFNTWLDDLATPAASLWSNGPGVAASGDTQLTQMHAYHYLAGARTAVRLASRPLTALGGHASGSNSYRDCLVASLITAHPGKSGRGRMYWPATGVTLVNHQANTGLVTDIAHYTAQFLADINASTIGAFGPTAIVAGLIDPPPPIIGVSCDTKIDSQENRSDKIAAFDKQITLL